MNENSQDESNSHAAHILMDAASSVERTLKRSSLSFQPRKISSGNASVKSELSADTPSKSSSGDSSSHELECIYKHFGIPLQTSPRSYNIVNTPPQTSPRSPDRVNTPPQTTFERKAEIFFGKYWKKSPPSPDSAINPVVEVEFYSAADFEVVPAVKMEEPVKIEAQPAAKV